MEIIVIENNEIKSKEIVNKISQSIMDARIFSIFYELKEAIPILVEKNIDIVIFDSYNQNLNNIEFVKVMEQIAYKTSFIVISNSKMPTIILMKNKYVYLKEKNFKKLSNDICKEVAKLNDELIINKIKVELKNLKFNFSHIGTSYLVQTIYEVYKKNENENINLSKDIFTIVGKKFNKTPNTIHSGIKRAVINMYCDCEENIINKYFDCFCFDERPRLKEIIYKVIEKIKEKNYKKRRL